MNSSSASPDTLLPLAFRPLTRPARFNLDAFVVRSVAGSQFSALVGGAAVALAIDNGFDYIL